MHRVPLQLKTPSVTWDRNLPEYVLFERTLNRTNVEETDNFLTIIDQETNSYFEYSHESATEKLANAHKLLEDNVDSEAVAKALHITNSIVLRCPKHAPALAAALKLRGSFYFEESYFEGASNDFEMYLHVNQQTNNCDDLCVVNGNLVICFYLMRQYEKTKRYLRAYNKHKAKLPRESFRKCHLGKIEIHISKFADELDSFEDVVPKFSELIYNGIPFKGFNTSENIPLSSAACYYVDESNKNQKTSGVYTNCDIPNGSVVLVEHPILQSINTPFVQCELCFRQRSQVYTCLDCRYKTYCSLQCIEKDRASHQEECIGYKYLTLLVLDAGMLFRIFIRISSLLHERIFSQKQFRKLTTAAAVLDKLETIINEKEIHGIQYLKLLRKPDYHKLSNMQYATLVATAFRLTIFIEKKTLAIETYYKKLHISNKQKMIVVGAVLMRLNCHLLTNTFDFEYNYPLSVAGKQAKQPQQQEQQSVAQQISEMARIVKPLRDERVIEDIERYYDIDVQTDIVEYSLRLLRVKPKVRITPNSLPILDHTQACNRIQRPLSTYKDIMAELYFNPDHVDFFLYGEAAGMPTTETSAAMICARIAEMDEMERYKFVMMFARIFHLHFAEYFLQINRRHKRIQQILALLCTTLSKFRHSCEPNVEVVVLENGVVMGKTLQPIIKGEELLVSYKANFMRHTRVERSVFLRRLNIECHCKYCTMPEVLEPSNQRQGIFCDSCDDKVEITPVHNKCQTCRTNYNNLLLKYKTEIKLYENEIESKLRPNADDRELYVLHMIFYRYAIRYFSPYNEFRIRAELKHAKFLALKNFAQQSYTIIMTVHKNLLRNYEECAIWFTFYAEILKIIKIILYYNLDENLYSISSSCLQELCMLALHINNGQKVHVQLYETFDYESSPILEDMLIILEWKEKILYNDVMPQTDSLKISHNQNKGKSKSERELLPTLSKVKK